jgi:hypothetical protein
MVVLGGEKERHRPGTRAGTGGFPPLAALLIAVLEGAISLTLGQRFDCGLLWKPDCRTDLANVPAAAKFWALLKVHQE